MKKYVMLALAAIFCLGISTSAQDQIPQGRGGQDGQRRQDGQGGQGMKFTAKDRAERLAKQLELSDVEKAKVLELYEKQDAKREKMRNENSELKTDRKEQFEADRKAEDAELEKIIGKEKFEKHLTLRAEREKRMKERGQNNDRPRQNGEGGQR